MTTNYINSIPNAQNQSQISLTLVQSKFDQIRQEQKQLRVELDDREKEFHSWLAYYKITPEQVKFDRLSRVLTLELKRYITTLFNFYYDTFFPAPSNPHRAGHTFDAGRRNNPVEDFVSRDYAMFVHNILYSNNGDGKYLQHHIQEKHINTTRRHVQHSLNPAGQVYREFRRTSHSGEPETLYTGSVGEAYPIPTDQKEDLITLIKNNPAEYFPDHAYHRPPTDNEIQDKAIKIIRELQNPETKIVNTSTKTFLCSDKCMIFGSAAAAALIAFAIRVGYSWITGKGDTRRKGTKKTRNRRTRSNKK